MLYLPRGTGMWASCHPSPGFFYIPLRNAPQEKWLSPTSVAELKQSWWGQPWTPRALTHPLGHGDVVTAVLAGQKPCLCHCRAQACPRQEQLVMPHLSYFSFLLPDFTMFILLAPL